jgi:hypothetical protein
MARITPTLDEIRAALLVRNAEHDPEFYVLVTEGQAADMASGYVPNSVRAQIRAMLDWQDEDRRRADRPVRQSSTVRKRATTKCP